MQQFNPLKTILLALIWLAIAPSLLACLGASQYRLFPIGQCKEGLMFLEAHLERTEYPNTEFEEAWMGTCYLSVYDTAHKLIKMELIRKSGPVLARNYLQLAKMVYREAVDRAQAQYPFTAAVPQTLQFADYSKAIPSASLIEHAKQNSLGIRLQNGRVYPVTEFQKRVPISEAFWVKFGDMDGKKLDVGLILENLYLSSVRSYALGSGKLWIVHIGHGTSLGDEEPYPPGKPYAPAFDFAKLEAGLFEEPVLWHGTSFDFFIWT